MKKYKKILSEQLSNRQNQLGRVQTSSQDLSSFGAGKQGLLKDKGALVFFGKTG